MQYQLNLPLVRSHSSLNHIDHLDDKDDVEGVGRVNKKNQIAWCSTKSLLFLSTHIHSIFFLRGGGDFTTTI